MKGMSGMGELIIRIVLCLFVVVALILFVRSAAENTDEATSGTLSGLREPTSMERLYCEIHCPDPDNNCDAAPDKVEICKIIAETPADFTYTGTVTGASSGSVSVEGSFIPGGVLEVSFSPEFAENYALIKKVKIYDAWDNEVESCVPNAAPPKCEFDLKDAEKKIIIYLPYKRDDHNIEELIKPVESYTLSLQEADGTEVLGLPGSWSCPSPQIRDGKYYPEKTIVFTFPTGGAHSWVDMENYETRPEKIEIGKRSGGAYPVCTTTTVSPTCKANVADVSIADEKRYSFIMPYTEPGKKVPISYPVYAKGVSITYVDSDDVTHNNAPMCRSGKEDYVYTCPVTACYTDLTGRYVVASLDSSGDFEANPACKYEIKQEQCALGCAMLVGNTGECLLPKPDLVNAYMAVKKGTLELFEEELNKDTGRYEQRDEIFITTSGYNKKRVFIAIKNNAREDGTTNEPRIKANNLKVTATLHSEILTVSPFPVIHYKSDDHVIDDAPDGNSELFPGDIFEYEIILDGLYEDIGDIGIHTVNIGLGVVGTFPTGLPAKFSSDTITARSYSYTVYYQCCRDCSCSSQSYCDGCSTRCKWAGVPGDIWVCMAK